MKNRIHVLVAALGTAFCANAQAQTSETVVYGVVMPFIESVKTQGATTAVPGDRAALVGAAQYTGLNDPARGRISVGTTQLGFRGYETLAPGLRAVWQLESGFQIDQNTGPGLGARNSKVGLAGGWGEVFLGQWDTPYKFISLPINPFRAGYVFDYTTIMGNPGLGVPATTTQFQRVGAKPDAAFDKRAGNSVQYWSPNWSGFQARLGWSTDEGATTPTATTGTIRPQIWSASFMYDIGGLSLRYAYEQHDDYFGLSALGTVAGSTAPASFTNASSKDRAHKVVGIYRFGNTRLAGAFEQLDYNNSDSGAGAITRYKRKSFYLLAEQKFGNHRVWVSGGEAADGQCSRNGVVCSSTSMGARYFTLGWIYGFSKRTEIFAAYYKLDNRESGTYSPQPVVGAVIAPGADTVGAGVGMIHYF